MSKVAIALVSFALGVATAFLVLSGSHTSVLAQAPPSQESSVQAMPSSHRRRHAPLLSQSQPRLQPGESRS